MPAFVHKQGRQIHTIAAVAKSHQTVGLRKRLAQVLSVRCTPVAILPSITANTAHVNSH